MWRDDGRRERGEKGQGADTKAQDASQQAEWEKNANKVSNKLKVNARILLGSK